MDLRPGGRGRGVRSIAGDRITEIAVAPTLRAAAMKRLAPGSPSEISEQGAIVERSDFRQLLRREEVGRLFVLVVDCSDSMGLDRRIASAKGAALSLLEDSGVTGMRVAVIGFGERSARTVVPPTASTYRAREALRRLSVGGATPTAAGLLAARDVVANESRIHPRSPATVVLLTDGEANVPLIPGGDIAEELRAVTAELSGKADRFVVVHTGTEGGDTLKGIAPNEYHHLESLAGRDVAAIALGGRAIATRRR